MTDQDMFTELTQRQIFALRGSNVRLSLLSVSVPTLPAPLLEYAVRGASASHDVVGPLKDGSIGLFSIESDGTAGTEHRFLVNLQNVLTPIAKRQDIGIIRFRAVHRWACELTDAFDLFDNLFDAPALLLTIRRPSSSPTPTRLPLRHAVPPMFSRFGDQLKSA